MPTVATAVRSALCCAACWCGVWTMYVAAEVETLSRDVLRAKAAIEREIDACRVAVDRGVAASATPATLTLATQRVQALRGLLTARTHPAASVVTAPHPAVEAQWARLALSHRAATTAATAVAAWAFAPVSDDAVAEAQLWAGESELALSHNDTALRIFDGLAANQSPGVSVVWRIRAACGVGRAYLATGDLDNSISALENARKGRRALYDPNREYAWIFTEIDAALAQA